MSVKCHTCSKQLSGQWNMTASGNCATGRFLGISDGYFLYQGNPNFVYCYCYQCWQQQILQLPFIHKSSSQSSLQQQINNLSAQLQQKIDHEKNLLTQIQMLTQANQQQMNNLKSKENQKSIQQLPEQEMAKLSSSESLKLQQQIDELNKQLEQKIQENQLLQKENNAFKQKLQEQAIYIQEIDKKIHLMEEALQSHSEEKDVKQSQIDQLTQHIQSQVEKIMDQEKQINDINIIKQQQQSKYEKEIQQKDDAIVQLKKTLQDFEEGQKDIFIPTKDIEKEILKDLCNFFVQIKSYLSVFTDEQHKEMIDKKIEYEILIQDYKQKQLQYLKEAFIQIQEKVFQETEIIIKQLNNKIDKIGVLINDLDERLKNEDSLVKDQKEIIINIPNKQSERLTIKLNLWKESLSQLTNKCSSPKSDQNQNQQQSTN